MSLSHFYCLYIFNRRNASHRKGFIFGPSGLDRPLILHLGVNFPIIFCFESSLLIPYSIFIWFLLLYWFNCNNTYSYFIPTQLLTQLKSIQKKLRRKKLQVKKMPRHEGNTSVEGPPASEKGSTSSVNTYLMLPEHWSVPSMTRHQEYRCCSDENRQGPEVQYTYLQRREGHRQRATIHRIYLPDISRGAWSNLATLTH